MQGNGSDILWVDWHTLLARNPMTTCPMGTDYLAQLRKRIQRWGWLHQKCWTGPTKKCIWQQLVDDKVTAYAFVESLGVRTPKLHACLKDPEQLSRFSALHSEPLPFNPHMPASRALCKHRNPLLQSTSWSELIALGKRGCLMPGTDVCTHRNTLFDTAAPCCLGSHDFQPWLMPLFLV